MKHDRQEVKKKKKSYSPAWNPECYKWSRECWADDFQCTHNLQVREKKKIECELERRCSHSSRLSCFYAARLSNILFCVLLPLLKRHFSPWVKFNWNASNRIKDFWSATRLPFQSKHYAQGELCYCSTPFIHQWAILALTPFQPPQTSLQRLPEKWQLLSMHHYMSSWVSFLLLPSASSHSWF